MNKSTREQLLLGSAIAIVIANVPAAIANPMPRSADLEAAPATATLLEANSPNSPEAHSQPDPTGQISQLPQNAQVQTPDVEAVPEVAESVVAEIQVNPNPALAQITSVSQLTDVQPTDWAFQALQSLVERYGCIVGYPDSTYRGNRALTRYEFAAGLSACLDRVNELIAAGTADLVNRDDLATLQRLQEEFATELATLRGRVDQLEARTAELEANQFSTTTKLNAEALFAVISILGGDRADGEPAERVPTLSQRVRINLESSFTGRDLLTTRLQAANVVPLGGTTPDGRGLGQLLTNEGRVEFDGDTNNTFGLGLLRYRFPIGPRTNFYLAGTGNGFVDLDASSQLNPYLDGGAVSLFGLRNPIYNYSAGAGAGIRHLFSDRLELNLGYLAPTANNPDPKNGLFNGQYGALAQLIFSPAETARIGLTYINAYSPFPSTLNVDDPFTLGATGSNLANSNFGTSVSINAYGLSGTVNFSPNLALSGWVGHAHHRYINRGNGSVWNWAVALAFPDIGRQGNLGGILVGMEPKLTSFESAVVPGQADQDTSLHVEAFYRHRFNDNIAVTPGLIWITAPNHNENNEDVFIGVLRTVFYF